MGKHKYVRTPEIMWKHFEDYVVWAKQNPYKVKDWVGGVAKEVVREKERPLTFVGFEVYLAKIGVISSGIEDYERNRDGDYAEFVPTIKMIKKVIEEDMLSGAAAGIYQQNIVARKLGIRDTVDDTGNKEITIKVKYARKGDNTEPTSQSSAEDTSRSEEV